ncbi:hypothetical protein PINS_up013680 [Pythium insidiosum]|nr:hypothetical protein PINS_up013680 [Pythium insidiosum]
MMSPFPGFGCPLALSLEQASPAFRAEVKLRVEKRVTTAAGQDLLQHMQKKTRLRSLDDLRSEARVAVLGEMERELRMYMQSVNWGSMPTPNGSEAATQSSSKAAAEPAADATSAPSGQGGVPAYLLSVAAAGFAAFYANQASLLSGIAAMSSPSAPATSTTTNQTTTPTTALPLSRQSSANTTSSSVSNTLSVDSNRHASGAQDSRASVIAVTAARRVVGGRQDEGIARVGVMVLTMAGAHQHGYIGVS